MTAPFTESDLAELGRLGRQAQDLLNARAGDWFAANEGTSHGSPRDGFFFDGGDVIAMRYDISCSIEDWDDHRMPANLLVLDDNAFQLACAAEVARRREAHERWLAEAPMREAKARVIRERAEFAQLAPRYATLAAKYGESVSMTERNIRS